jgi:hypothetical protein
MTTSVKGVNVVGYQMGERKDQKGKGIGKSGKVGVLCWTAAGFTILRAVAIDTNNKTKGEGL